MFECCDKYSNVLTSDPCETYRIPVMKVQLQHVVSFNIYTYTQYKTQIELNRPNSV